MNRNQSHGYNVAVAISELQSRIWTELKQRMHRYDTPSRSFICEQDIRDVWNDPETTPLTNLANLLDWDYRESSFVRGSLVKTLSVLVWIGGTDWLNFKQVFLAGRYRGTDENLPIEDTETLYLLFPNDPATAARFQEKQYIFIPIKVVEDDDALDQSARWSHHYRLPSISSVSMGEGTAGVVTKELIAARHIRYANQSENHEDCWIACKRIKGSDDPGSVSFDAEAENQKRFKWCLNSNRNIMLSFATIIRGPEFCIFSKLADCNLSELFAGTCYEFSRYCSRATPIALLQEAYCLVGALKFLHHGLDTPSGKMLCAHMDLKPDNILVTWRGPSIVGRWQITDFGISRIKKPRTVLNRNSLTPLGNIAEQYAGMEMTPTIAPRGSGAFQAPEVGSTSNRVVGQESDMWSFGCILATVLAFASGGPEEVRMLYKARDNGDQDYFYTTISVDGRDEVAVKPEFRTYFEALGPNESWMASSRSLVLDMLRIKPIQRENAERAQVRLHRIYEEGVRTTSGTALCSWVPLPDAVTKHPGLELVDSANSWGVLRNRDIVEDFAPSPVRIGDSWRVVGNQEVVGRPMLQPMRMDTARRFSGNSQIIEQPGLEAVQSAISRSSSHSTHTVQNSPPSSTPAVLGDSPRPSFTSQITPKPPQERLDTNINEEPLFVRLERPVGTKKSRLCPSAQRAVYVSDRSIRIYDVAFLSAARKWERDRFGRKFKTVVAADIPAGSQGLITWPEHMQLIASSIAGTYIAVLLKAARDRQHEVHLHRFTANSNSQYSPNTQMIPPEPVTFGPLHDISVSSQGAIIAHLNNELKLFSPLARGNSVGGFDSSPRGSIENGSSIRWVSLKVTGSIQGAAFSHDGSWIYAWSRDEKENHWYIWRALGGQIFIRGRLPFRSDGLHGGTGNIIIPFVSSPFFLAGDDQGVLIMIGGWSSRGKCHKLPRTLLGISAAAIAPEENAVILARKIQGQADKHELSILHLPQDLATCRLTDDLWIRNRQIREVYRGSGAIAVYRSSAGVCLLGSNPDGTLEHRLIGR